MGKSINELLSDLKEEGTDNSHEQSKKVKCSGCGRLIPAPGHPDESRCWNCKTIRVPNNDLITQRWGMLARDKTIVKKKRATYFKSVDSTDSFNKTVDDQT